MRPQSVLNAMTKIQGAGSTPSPQTNLPPIPQAGPITGAKATNISASPLAGDTPDVGSASGAVEPAKTNFAPPPAWKNFAQVAGAAVKKGMSNAQ